MKTPVLPYSLCKLFKGSELFTVTDEYLSVVVDFISIFSDWSQTMQWLDTPVGYFSLSFIYR